MICVFMKGKLKQVIGSPKSGGWLKPGDDDHPYTVFKTEGAFITKWKALEKSRFKLVRFDSSPPKKKKSSKKYSATPVRAGATVDVLAE